MNQNIFCFLFLVLLSTPSAGVQVASGGLLRRYRETSEAERSETTSRINRNKAPDSTTSRHKGSGGDPCGADCYDAENATEGVGNILGGGGRYGAPAPGTAGRTGGLPGDDSIGGAARLPPPGWHVAGDDEQDGQTPLFPPAAIVDIGKLRPLAAAATSFALLDKQKHPQEKCAGAGGASKELVPCLMPEIGNGYFATVSPICHPNQQDCGKLFVAGMYGHREDLKGHADRSALPNPFYGVWPAGKSGPHVFSAGVLDVKGGSLLFQWQVEEDSGSVIVQFRFYAHRARKNLLVLEITTDSAKEFDLKLTQKPAHINVEDALTARLAEFRTRSGGKRGKLRTSRTKDRENDKLQADFIRVVEAHSDDTDPSGDKRLSRLPETVKGLSRKQPKLFLVAFASNANEGEGVVQNGLKDRDDLYPEAKLEQVAMKSVDDALALGNGDPLERAKKLYREHAAAWAELWEGGVEVAGAGDVATKSEKTTMFSMYYLLSSCRHDVSWSTSPGGLSTNGYGGHVFWDTEVWMYPGMLLFFPEVVKTGMLQYRLKTLEGAQHRSATNWKKGPLCENGQSHSSCETEGARFAWEAALTGIEAGVGNAGTVTNEVHVTGGVAFAADLFYRAHRGTRRGVDFMFQHGSTSSRASSSNGYEALLKETANFWSSYVTWEGEKARLLKVIPPDEEAGYVDDSIATNAMAQRNLEAALRWNPEVHDATKSPVAASVDYELKVGDGEEAKKWERTRKGLQQVYNSLYNKQDDAHVEYVGFNWQKKVKQADTVLLGFPLDRISLMPHQENTFRNDLLFAERAYNPDAPCMTHSAQMTGWLTLKMVRKAATCLEKAHANAHGAFRIWTEYPTGGVTHFLTGMGGFLQTMTYGMAGLRLHPDGMALSPNLVDGMRRYALRGVWFLGCVLRLEWEASGEGDSAEEVKFFVSVARCMGEEDQLHGRFPIVARWHQVVGTGDSEDDELQLRKMEHRFDSAARMNVKFQPDFGSFRRFEKKGFPSLLLQHEKDRHRWLSVDGPLENKKTCGTAREGKDYDGSPEGYVASAWIKKEGTAEECRAACEEAAECEAYTLGHLDGNCMFKRKKQNGFKDNKQCESGECTFKKRKIKYTT